LESLPGIVEFGWVIFLRDLMASDLAGRETNEISQKSSTWWNDQFHPGCSWWEEWI